MRTWCTQHAAAECVLLGGTHLQATAVLSVWYALWLNWQVLNLAVYQLLGSKGVYYGAKFGKKVSWHRGFPFNIVRHPQYVGAVLTIWVCMALVWGQAPGGMLVLALYWTLLYAATASWEEFL